MGSAHVGVDECGDLMPCRFRVVAMFSGCIRQMTLASHWSPVRRVPGRADGGPQSHHRPTTATLHAQYIDPGCIRMNVEGAGTR